MADMSDCITALRAEIVELREALKEAIKDAPKTVEVKDSKQVAPRNSSVAWSTVSLAVGKRKRKTILLSPNVPLKTRTLTPVIVAKVQRPKAAVEGKRKVWGTLRTTTT